MKLLRILICLVEDLSDLNNQKNNLFDRVKTHYYEVEEISRVLKKINETENDIRKIKESIEFDNELKTIKE